MVTNGEVYDPTTPITSNITLVASWKEDYKVTIHYNNNDPDLVLYAKEGQSINDLGGIDSPIKEGYKFINFYYDEEFTKAMLIFLKSTMILICTLNLARFIILLIIWMVVQQKKNCWQVMLLRMLKTEILI